MRKNRKARIRARRKQRESSQMAAVSPPPATPSSVSPAASVSRVARYACAAVFAVCAYLSLVNLDWITLWDDEAISAHLARNWSEFGEMRADDGRNIYSPVGRKVIPGENSSEVDSEGIAYYPPLMPWLTSMVFTVFGAGDVQARILSALMVLASMVVFAFILRREFPRAPGLAVAAFALACLSPLVLGYARSATYNAPVLLAHMVVFLAYLEICARRKLAAQITWAAVMAAAAIAGFHAHYLSNLMFMGALVAVHLIYRRREFDRNAWFAGVAAGGVYLAQIGWMLVIADIGGGYGMHAPDWSKLPPALRWEVFQLSHNGMLTWSVALWLILWRTLAWLRHPRLRVARPAFFAPKVWGDDDAAILRATHYLVLTLCGSLMLALSRTVIDYSAARFMTSFAPFALVVAAAAVYWAWRRSRTAAIALMAVLLLSNAAGWPMLSGAPYQANRPKWTLPALAVEYHRHFPDLQRESLDYIRENVRKDSVFYVDYHGCGWTVLLWELSDHLHLCCSLNRPAKWADTTAREYLFTPRVMGGEVTPDYLYLSRFPPFHEKISLPGERSYRRMPDFPEPIYRIGGGCSPGRPEPAWRNPRPDLVKDRTRRSLLYQLERP